MRVFLVSPTSNGCLETENGFTGLDSCNQSPNQVWEVTSPENGYVTIKNLATGECLAHFEQTYSDVFSVKCRAGDRSQLWTEDKSEGPAGQRFSTAQISDVVACMAASGDAAVLAPCQSPDALWLTQPAG